MNLGQAACDVVVVVVHYMQSKLPQWQMQYDQDQKLLRRNRHQDRIHHRFQQN